MAAVKICPHGSIFGVAVLLFCSAWVRLSATYTEQAGHALRFWPRVRRRTSRQHRFSASAPKQTRGTVHLATCAGPTAKRSPGARRREPLHPKRAHKCHRAPTGQCGDRWHRPCFVSALIGSAVSAGSPEDPTGVTWPSQAWFPPAPASSAALEWAVGSSSAQSAEDWQTAAAPALASSATRGTMMAAGRASPSTSSRQSTRRSQKTPRSSPTPYGAAGHTSESPSWKASGAGGSGTSPGPAQGKSADTTAPVVCPSAFTTRTSVPSLFLPGPRSPSTEHPRAVHTPVSARKRGPCHHLLLHPNQCIHAGRQPDTFVGRRANHDIVALLAVPVAGRGHHPPTWTPKCPPDAGISTSDRHSTPDRPPKYPSTAPHRSPRRCPRRPPRRCSRSYRAGCRPRWRQSVRCLGVCHRRRVAWGPRAYRCPLPPA